MDVVVIGAGMAGLTAARALVEAGHRVTVLDKARRPGGRLATRDLAGGARADHGAQFFTVRSEAFEAVVTRWRDEGAVWEWCDGFEGHDGHPRYAAVGGMAALAGRMAAGLDVRQSTRVEAVHPVAGGWGVDWAAGHGRPAGSARADAVLTTAPVPQSSALVGAHADLPELAYSRTISLLVALAGTPSVPPPGGVQASSDPVWSWIGDNVAKRASAVPSVTFHTRADMAATHWDEDDVALMARLRAAAAPWLGGAPVVEAALHRWRYAAPVDPHPDRCWMSSGGGIVLAGDAFGGPRVEGAFLSGRAAAAAIERRR